ncbi:MAG: reverse transcriptase-like protein [Terriglobia bacterium]
MNKKTAEEPTIFYIDGGSRGNPGPAGYGVAIKNAAGETVDSRSEYLGVRTNNVAEYSGLLAALEYATSHHLPFIRIFSDSELLVRQMTGRYRVKSPDLLPLFERARELAAQIPRFEIEHIRREANAAADALANEAMDRGEAVGPHRRTLRFDAIVENGLLKPLAPVQLPEKKKVECSIRFKD